MKTPIAHHRICHAQIDGTPNIQLSGSFGAPNAVLPITAPGPMANRNQTTASAQARGTRRRFSSGRPACSRRKSWKTILCLRSDSSCVTADTAMATPRLNRMPQPAEWIVSGQRPHASIPSCWPMDSVAVTATRPAARPRVTPARVSQGHQHTAISAGHIWNP